VPPAEEESPIMLFKAEVSPVCSTLSKALSTLSVAVADESTVSPPQATKPVIATIANIFFIVENLNEGILKAIAILLPSTFF